MEFKILGSLEVLSNGRDIAPSAPKLRRVLSLLLLHPNQIVRTAALIDELWGDEPVRSAMTTMQTYIYLLRKIFDAEHPSAGNILVTKPAGYIVVTPEETIDLFRFEALAEEGRSALAAGEPEAASARLGEALSLWRGPALADVQTGRLLDAHVTRLGEARLRAVELRIEADLCCGRHRELISELKGLTTSHAYHEGFYKQLMLALYRSGRQCEALDLYQSVRQCFVKDLGVEPSAELRRLQRDILDAAPRLDLNAQVRAHDRRSVRPPAQLPPDIADFTARSEEVSMAEAALKEETGDGRPPIVTFIGMPGAGKTACALRTAHRVRTRFPDGQLYANLRSSTGDGASIDRVLYGFLRAIGVSRDKVPATREERAALFRARTAQRRLLILLDDVASAEQVTALLPGGRHCGMLVTGRTPLAGLRDMCEIKVTVMSAEDGIELLAQIVGRARVERERRAAELIVRSCDNLPLAIRAAGARLAIIPELSLGRFHGQLADEQQRLDRLDSTDFALRTEYEASYQRLSETDRAAARWLSLFVGESFSANAVSALLGRNPASTRVLLSQLVSHHFVRPVGTDAAGEAHYSFFGLPRALLSTYAMGAILESLRA
ncbi:BTAD domain-containing putative transcriptional regulator [Nonomuraea fastidiosa]|uniref:AfsR/SARP family transcriptional regulator n=1 Tax=Nonomuraea TaxID=83681 RepID=UPI0034377E7D